MKFYKFTEYGKQVTYKTWRSLGGCGLPNNTQARYYDNITLGEIAEQCPYTERGLARYAKEALGMDCFVEEYNIK